MWASNKIILITGIILLASVALGVLVHYVFQPKPPHEYTTLSQISAYADTLPEFPKSDDSDWLDPRYKTFYEERSPTLFQRSLHAFGINQAESFSPRYLSTMVKYLTKQNHRIGLAANGKPSFIHIKAIKETKLYIFGDLHSAFHSLIRDLKYLEKLGVINDQLEVDEYSYLIFNGDVIDRSAYNIDTLILVATLMKKNPLNVFYVMGNHERNSRWLDFGLKRELVARGSLYSKQLVPFRNQIDDFFASLPEAIYVSGTEPDTNVIRIAFYDQQKLAYDETRLSTTFLHQDQRVMAYTFTAGSLGSSVIDVRSAFKSEEWQKINRIRHGLGLLDQDQGATVWAVLSSPITVNMAYLNFYDDAFAQVVIGDDIKRSTISLIFRDVRTKADFQIEAPSNLISARPSEEPTIPNTVKVGSTMSLVRGVPTVGQQVDRGLNLMVNRFNGDSNTTRNRIRLYVDNDDYVPRVASTNVSNFIKSGIKYLLLPTGTPTTLSYIDMVQDRDFAIFFPISGAAELRNPRFRKLVNFRAAYEDEVRALIATLAEEYGALKFAFFYQDDSYGRGPYLAAVAELARRGITNSLAMPYTRGSTSFEAQISQLQKSQPDALGFFSTATAAEEFIRQTGVTAIANTQLFAISFVGELTLRRFGKKHGLSFLFGSAVPNPKVSNTAIAKAYRKAMDYIQSDYDVFSFEAFIATGIFLHAIESLKGERITPNRVISTMEHMKNFDFNGILLNFNKNTRSLAKQVWLETDEDKEWKEYPVK